MYDNGLLKYYRQKNYKDGFLKTSDIDLTPVEDMDERTTKCCLPEGMFFNKFMDKGQVGKRGLDSEILLSQIYNKFGLTSAIYLPVVYNGQNSVLSNDITHSSTSQVISAYDCIKKALDEGNSAPPVDFLSPKAMKMSLSSFFTQKAIEQQIKMRVLDSASYVNDRHARNFYYVLNQGKIDDIACIDFEDSASSASEYDKEWNFLNDLVGQSQTRDEIIEFYRTSPDIAHYVDKPRLAEDIGSLNPQGIAEDIKQTIGYQVDTKYTDFLAKSYDEMAEALIQ